MRTLLMKAAVLAIAGLLSPAPAGAAHRAHSEPAVQVGIVLFDGVQIIDFAAPYEVFGQAGFGVATVSADGGPVTTAMGLAVTPDHGFADAPPFDVLLVPGGDTGDAERDEVLLGFVRGRAASARHVLSVCTGSHILGASGLLDGLRATTFHRALSSLASKYPEIDVVRDVRWVDNGAIVTSAGLSSGIDAALHIVGKERGADAASTVAMHLEYDWRPEDGFVRTRMADRHLPDLGRVQWPEATRFDRIVNTGDTRSWRMRYRVSTDADAEALMALAAEALDGTEGWTRASAASTRDWVGAVEGERLRMAIGMTAAGPGTHWLDVELETAAEEEDDDRG
ncbi:DJ-1/PfpI family protein [Luteimonas sp. SJ-92]|uniref:DJ-1/PfpI family protein n=1 Tax=Luteimonas salinisoli TaxID=2752307 RepID=A0A853J969_9GAMM|nr:DJ-1/PfpI family protein [Luteimonas salinisoli]NZA25701.1 DJ-1/PfpI family protein [Luteimonas salinisoli]